MTIKVTIRNDEPEGSTASLKVTVVTVGATGAQDHLQLLAPGQASGQKWNDLSACNVSVGNTSAKMGAVADGLVDVPNQDNKCISGHLVALVISGSGINYNWILFT